mmetsp:Transcript_10245/g.12488  ORF Transcript_10245/g.12488 Transcript_10245/m.12488 type:complete len:113 (-) Transcript_10245:56-394(-)
MALSFLHRFSLRATVSHPLAAYGSCLRSFTGFTSLLQQPLQASYRSTGFFHAPVRLQAISLEAFKAEERASEGSRLVEEVAPVSMELMNKTNRLARKKKRKRMGERISLRMR